MSNEIKKARADKIRLEILTISDEELINFGHAIYGGEDFKGDPLESVGDHVKRIAKIHLANMPF